MWIRWIRIRNYPMSAWGWKSKPGPTRNVAVHVLQVKVGTDGRLNIPLVHLQVESERPAFRFLHHTTFLEESDRKLLGSNQIKSNIYFPFHLMTIVGITSHDTEFIAYIFTVGLM